MHYLATIVALNPFYELLRFLFGWLYDLLKFILSAIHSGIDPYVGSNYSWGLSIILMTVLVRLVLFPVTWRQYKSGLAMQGLQPKIKELQRKYKNDKAKLQQETMRLYQEYQINPFASCLPLLLQMPVFIALYYAIRGTEALRAASFLWLPELGKPDPYYILFIIYIASQIISTELTMTAQTDPQQKWIMRAMPVMIVIFLFHFPSGLFLYWVTTNVWTIGQQLLIRARMPATLGPPPPPKEGKKRSRFMEAYLQAQEKAAQQREARVGQGDGATRRAKTGVGKAAGGKAAGGKSVSKAGTSRAGAGKTGVSKASAGSDKTGAKAGAARSTKKSGKSAASGATQKRRPKG